MAVSADASPLPRQKNRRGRKPKGGEPAPVRPVPDKPDPDHVLTWRQRKVLQVIRDSVRQHGYPPSMREIAKAVGLTSTSSVAYQLGVLQDKGYLRRDVGRPRTVEVRLPGQPAVRPPDGTPPLSRTAQTSRCPKRLTCRSYGRSPPAARPWPRTLCWM